MHLIKTFVQAVMTYRIVFNVHITQMVNQCLTGILLPPVDSSMKWCPTVHVLGIDVSSSLQQHTETNTSW